MPKQQMTSETRGVGRLLHERRYFQVPPHQRDFAWPIGAVEQFLEDIVDAMRSGDAEYFLGLIVLVDTDNAQGQRYQILDGQQRLATATMVYAAIRHWLRERGMDEDGLKIQNDFIGISDIGEEEPEPRIILNLQNRGLFQEVVVNACPDSILQNRMNAAGRHSSARKLLEAALRCRAYIQDLAASRGKDQKAQARILFDLAKYLRDQVQVDCLDVKDPEDAYTIFESLNDRGIDLSVMDLLKNHIFREATGVNEDEVQHYWTTMLARLGDRRGDDFIKAFWTSRFGRIQRGRLFKELRKTYQSRKQVMAVAKELATVAEKYANLEVMDAELWRPYSDAARESISALEKLGARQTHPILLAALEVFKPDQMEKLLRHLVVLIVRYQLVGRGRTGRLEIQAATVAKGIYNKTLKSANAVWREIKPLVPNDEEFKEDFSRYEETKPERVRWLLRELEIQTWCDANRGKGPQFAPLTDANKVNLEHILPRNPGEQWNSIIRADSELVRECVNRLGNLCLLDRPSNKQKAAQGFHAKSRIYGASELILTKRVSERWHDWNRNSIEERQAELAEIAVSVWPL